MGGKYARLGHYDNPVLLRRYHFIETPYDSRIHGLLCVDLFIHMLLPFHFHKTFTSINTG